MAITAPLWGVGELLSKGDIKELEANIANHFLEFCEGLENAGLTQERRSTQLLPEKLNWAWQDSSLLLSFSLPKGTYATSMLREVVDFQDASLV